MPMLLDVLVLVVIAGYNLSNANSRFVTTYWISVVCLCFKGSGLKEAARAASVRARDAEDHPAPVGFLQPHLRAGRWKHHRDHGGARDDPHPGERGGRGPSHGPASRNPRSMSSRVVLKMDCDTFLWTKTLPSSFLLSASLSNLCFKRSRGAVFAPETWTECCVLFLFFLKLTHNGHNETRND